MSQSPPPTNPHSLPALQTSLSKQARPPMGNLGLQPVSTKCKLHESVYNARIATWTQNNGGRVTLKVKPIRQTNTPILLSS